MSKTHNWNESSHFNSCENWILNTNFEATKHMGNLNLQFSIHFWHKFCIWVTLLMITWYLILMTLLTLSFQMDWLLMPLPTLCWIHVHKSYPYLSMEDPSDFGDLCAKNVTTSLTDIDRYLDCNSIIHWLTRYKTSQDNYLNMVLFTK